MGTLAQLALEGYNDEAATAASFFVQIGLPVHLEQLSLAPDCDQELAAVIEAALAFPFIENMPEKVSTMMLYTALLAADEIGQSAVGNLGDEAYRRLHSNS